MTTYITHADRIKRQPTICTDTRGQTTWLCLFEVTPYAGTYVQVRSTLVRTTTTTTINYYHNLTLSVQQLNCGLEYVHALDYLRETDFDEQRFIRIGVCAQQRARKQPTSKIPVGASPHRKIHHNTDTYVLASVYLTKRSV